MQDINTTGYEDDKTRKLLAALQRAVDLYGKPGGPWNVPSEPGSWIAEAREAIAQATRKEPA